MRFNAYVPLPGPFTVNVRSWDMGKHMGSDVDNQTLLVVIMLVVLATSPVWLPVLLLYRLGTRHKRQARKLRRRLYERH